MSDDLFDHLIRRMTGQEEAVALRQSSAFAADRVFGPDPDDGWEQTELLVAPTASVPRPDLPLATPRTSPAEPAPAPEPHARTTRVSASPPAPRADPPAASALPIAAVSSQRQTPAAPPAPEPHNGASVDASAGRPPAAPAVPLHQVSERVIRHESAVAPPMPATDRPAKVRLPERTIREIENETKTQREIVDKSRHVTEQIVRDLDRVAPRTPGPHRPAAPVSPAPVPTAAIRPAPENTASPPPSVSIHIDSVEIHAAAPTPVAPRKPAPRRAPALGLDAYLAGKGGRG